MLTIDIWAAVCIGVYNNWDYWNGYVRDVISKLFFILNYVIILAISHVDCVFIYLIIFFIFAMK